MLKLVHAPDTRSVRILWMLEELGLPYELELYKLGDKAMRSPEYLEKLHPLGRVPVLIDGDTKLFESGAIVEYLIERHGGGRLRPAVDSPDFAPYLQWLHYAEGMLMPQVNIIMVETRFLPPEKRHQPNVDRAQKLLSRMLVAVDAWLEGRDYLAGEFSGADIMCGHACLVSARLGGDVSALPNLQRYGQRLEAREALQRARAVGVS
ncbi:MAG: glutathione S-transferase family protein [Burkholderiaceae bacterium]